MKVLVSRKDLKDTTSGVPKKVLQEIKYFSERGHDAFAIAEAINAPLIEEFGGTAVKTFRLPISGYPRRKFYQYQVERWIRKNRPDIVIGHGDIVHQDVCFIHNCVHLAHELIEGKPLPKEHDVGRIHEEILRTGDFKLLICNSQLMKNDLIRRFGVDEEKAVVIYPEVNLAKFTVDDPVRVRKEWRAKFGYTEDDFVFGLITSGNLKKRNFPMLLEAFQELGVGKLFVAGGGTDQKPVPGVTFAPSIIDVKNYYYLIDAFILPAHIEEFGRSVLEAMYCGKPVITTDKVGASEILEGKSRDYILKDSRDKEALKLLMRQALSDTDVGERNHQTAMGFSAEKQNKLFEEYLEKFQVIS